MSEGERHARRLTEMAWILTVLLGASILGQRVAVLPVVALEDVAARKEWLAGFPVGWTLSWGGWMLCSFAFLGLFLFLRAVARDARLGGALWAAAAAIVIGLVGRVLLAGGLSLAATLEDPDRFAVIERVLWMVELIPTRILQATALFLACRELQRVDRIDHRVTVLAGLYCAVAVGMAWFATTADPSAASPLVAPESGLLVAWALSVQQQVRERRGSG